ncbi:MAG TPA: alpha/beta fold hydrolase [Polyangiaceae bacterium]|nr:alpha/beta fold hydrolase [Polyangiaceae bacterium]
MAISRVLGLSSLLITGATLAGACGGAQTGATTAPPPSDSVAAAPAEPGLAAPHADPALLPRKVLFGQVDRSEVKISPDGKSIGWLGPSGGAMNVWVAPADDVKKGRPVTQNRGDDIRAWWWSYGSNRVLFTNDKNGDDSVHVFVVDLAKNETKDMTPVDGIHAELLGLSPRRPGEALVSLNERDRKFHDVVLVDLATGTRRIVQQNDGGFEGWITDDDLRVRFATRRNADASLDLLEPTQNKGAKDVKDRWAPFEHIDLDDTLTVRAVGFDKTGSSLYLKDSRNRDTSALFSVDAKTGAPTMLAEDARADIGQVLVHPTNKTVEAVLIDYDKPTWKVVDASVEGDFYYLTTSGDGTLDITSRSLDEQHWLVAYKHSDGPTHYYRYDRDADIPGNPGKATFLFTGSDALERAKLANTAPVVIKARDGLDLVSYLTIPYDADPGGDGRPKQPIPMVVLVHDGPWIRATLEYSRETQWLATRGYAVLNVNYRGSSGFGKKFLNAGNFEWGGKMSDDLVDAVHWAVDQKIADPGKVAIVGAGYGGYAALVGMERSADTFACGVDQDGPSNLVTFLPSLPADAFSELEAAAKRVGDWRTDDGKKLLEARSPVARAESIRSPLLIGQGKDDWRVREPESTAFVAILKSKRVPVTYAVYTDEEQEFEDPANRTSFGAVAEVFLAQCLGGSYQPIGRDLAGSSLSVPVGARFIYGLHDPNPGALAASVTPPREPAGSAAPQAPAGSAAPPASAAGSATPAPVGSGKPPAPPASSATAAPPGSAAAPSPAKSAAPLSPATPPAPATSAAPRAPAK